MSKITKAQELQVLESALSKLPRDDMRAINKKLGIKTGHQKPQTVRNLAQFLVG